MTRSPAMSRWSRRPYVGALPRVMRARLPAASALEGLRALLDGPEVTGDIDGSQAWLRTRAAPRPPASTLRLTIRDDAAGARIDCRFDESRWDEMDIWIYGIATAFGVVVATSWLSGHLPAAARAHISAAAPVFMAALAVVAVAHFAFRRWRKAVRDRLFDQAMIALGVPIE